MTARQEQSQMKRHALTLRGYLGDGGRAHDFEQWVNEHVKLLKRADTFGSESGKAWGRLLGAFSVGTVEVCNQLRADGIAEEDILAAIPDAAGFAILAAIWSVLEDDCPRHIPRKLIKEGIIRGMQRFYEACDHAHARADEGLVREP